MKELELKHLAGYLPYGLKGVLTEDKQTMFAYELDLDNNLFVPGVIWKLCGYAPGDLNIYLGDGIFDGWLWRNETTYVNFHKGIKPILRPLSDLIKEIEVDGEKFVPLYKLDSKCEDFYFSYGKETELSIKRKNTNMYHNIMLSQEVLHFFISMAF